MNPSAQATWRIGFFLVTYNVFTQLECLLTIYLVDCSVWELGDSFLFPCRFLHGNFLFFH